MIQDFKINQVREAARDNIYEVIGKSIDLKKNGENYKGKCPFHQDNTPSMIVSPEKGIYKCFVCQDGGDALDFVIKESGKDFIEVIRELADKFHIDLEEQPWKSGNRYIPPEELLPGISEMKYNIRKQKYCLLFFRDRDIEQFVDLESVPWLKVDTPLSTKQAELLHKYTENILFKADSKFASSEDFFKSLRACMQQNRQDKLGANLGVSIHTDDCAPEIIEYDHNKSIRFPYNQDWVVYVLKNCLATYGIRRQIVKTIAAIDDNIYRSIYKKEFQDGWKEKVTPKF